MPRVARTHPAGGSDEPSVLSGSGLERLDIIGDQSSSSERAPGLDPPGSDRDHPANVFAPYFDVAVRFGEARTRDAGLRAAPIGDVLPAIVDYALLARWGKQPLSRDAARARLVAA